MELDAGEGDRIDRRGGGESQAQPVVDRGAHGAGFRADARRGLQDGPGQLLAAVALLQGRGPADSSLSRNWRNRVRGQCSPEVRLMRGHRLGTSAARAR